MSTQRRVAADRCIPEKFSGRSRTSANHRRTFFGNDAAYLHGRVTALVRDVDPADWDGKDMFISTEGDEVDAAFDPMMARLRGGPTATE
jgi:hypothetical protein